MRAVEADERAGAGKVAEGGVVLQEEGDGRRGCEGAQGVGEDGADVASAEYMDAGAGVDVRVGGWRGWRRMRRGVRGGGVGLRGRCVVCEFFLPRRRCRPCFFLSSAGLWFMWRALFLCGGGGQVS